MENLPKQVVQSMQNAVSLGNTLVQQNTYNAQITRQTPTAFVLLLDQSGSMHEGSFDIAGQTMNKAEALAYHVNTVLAELVQKSTKQYGIGDYVDVCILGYGAAGNNCEPAWIGKLAGKTWVTINELEQCAIKETLIVKQIGRGGVERTETQELKKWIEPVHKGGTPLAAALSAAHKLCDEWIRSANHKECYPPTIVNFTDGQATDVSNPNDLIPLGNKITSLHTQDGNVLLYNCHISSLDYHSCLFPKNTQELPNDQNATVLYHISSFIPQRFNHLIANARHDMDTFNQYKGMVFNAPISTVASMLQLGTSQVK